MQQILAPKNRDKCAICERHQHACWLDTRQRQNSRRPFAIDCNDTLADCKPSTYAVTCIAGMDREGVELFDDFPKFDGGGECNIIILLLVAKFVAQRPVQRSVDIWAYVQISHFA